MDAATESLLRQSFAAQGAMRALGVQLETIAPGHCCLSLARHAGALQQHGFFHGGIIGAIADSAGGYAANALLMPAREVLTAEYKINFLAPARGARLKAEGRVVRQGKSLVVVSVDVFSGDNDTYTPCALAQMTMFAIPRRVDDVAHGDLST